MLLIKDEDRQVKLELTLRNRIILTHQGQKMLEFERDQLEDAVKAYLTYIQPRVTDITAQDAQSHWVSPEFTKVMTIVRETLRNFNQ